MKERPILFSGPMVRALMEGRKTQTRRVVKPSPAWSSAPLEFTNAPGCWAPNEAEDMRRCPYGVPGDRLWVRETWRPLWDGVDEPGQLGDCIQYQADLAKVKPEVPDIETGYRFDNMCDAEDSDPRWRPSIHMPRWACRIELEVTAVRVEGVRDISEADAVAEGFAERRERVGNAIDWQGARAAFLETFYDLNKRAPWTENPWVWVIEFNRVN